MLLSRSLLSIGVLLLLAVVIVVAVLLVVIATVHVGFITSRIIFFLVLLVFAEKFVA